MMDKVMLQEAFESMVNSELTEMVKKGDITPTDVENATKAMKLLEKMKHYFRDEEPDMGYSGTYYPNSYGYGVKRMVPTYSRNGSYQDRGNSYNNSYGGMDYSRHGVDPQAIERLERMKEQAQTDQERMAIENAIENMMNN